MPLATIITNDGVTVAFNGYIRQVRSDSSMFKHVLDLIKQKVSDTVLMNAMDLASKIKSHASGLFDIGTDGLVYIAGEGLPDSLSKRILAFANEGFDFEPLVKFWNNCKQNPDPRAKTDLYAFLEQNGIPITSDGCFIGYRAIRNDWYDKYTGKILNNIGAVVTMKRELCDPDPKVTCSRGLHIAAYPYAKFSYGSGDDRIIECKVNPEDVVAIPDDYNGQKMRVCKYVVMAENKEGLIGRQVYDPQNVKQDSDEVVLDKDATDWQDDSGADDESFAQSTPGPVPSSVTYAGNDAWKSQKRDSKGRFLPKV